MSFEMPTKGATFSEVDLNQNAPNSDATGRNGVGNGSSAATALQTVANILESGTSTGCLFIVAAFQIAMIVIGGLFKDQCPINHKIPIWMIVAGVLGILPTLIRTVLNLFIILKIHTKSPKIEKLTSLARMQMFNFLFFLVALFLLAWFIAGSVWVYSAKRTVITNINKANDPNYCHPTCYWFAFSLITATYCFMALACCFGCLSTLCIGCGFGTAAIFDKL